MQLRRGGVPSGNAVGATILDVKISSGRRRLQQHGDHLAPTTERLEFSVPERTEELELLRVATERPGQTTRPRAELRITQLRVRAAVATVFLV